MGRSLTQKGLRSLAYAIALSSGKPSEKNEMRKSQTGQFSTSSSRMTLSPKTITSNSPSLINLLRMLRLGLLLALLSRAQTPILPMGTGLSCSGRSVLGLALLTVLLLTRLDWGVLPRGFAFEDGGGWRGKVAKTLALGEVVVEPGSELVGGGRVLSRLMVVAGAECVPLREGGSEREAASSLGAA